jgi:hypothetical protein
MLTSTATIVTTKLNTKRPTVPLKKTRFLSENITRIFFKHSKASNVGFLIQDDHKNGPVMVAPI